jgi:intracellular sulfur oxidation DsrE/DsrF family protein
MKQQKQIFKKQSFLKSNFFLLLTAAAVIVILTLTFIYKKRSFAQTNYNYGNDPILLRYSGSAVTLPYAADKPSHNTPVKAIFSILNFPANPNLIPPGLRLVAHIVNLYRVAGVNPKDVHLDVVFHGNGTPAAFDNQAYSHHLSKPDLKVTRNPNIPLIRELQKDGVKMFVCGQAMRVLHYKRKDILPGIKEVYSGLTFIINRQNHHYAYFEL